MKRTVHPLLTSSACIYPQANVLKLCLRDAYHPSSCFRAASSNFPCCSGFCFISLLPSFPVCFGCLVSWLCFQVHRQKFYVHIHPFMWIWAYMCHSVHVAVRGWLWVLVLAFHYLKQDPPAYYVKRLASWWASVHSPASASHLAVRSLRLWLFIAPSFRLISCVCTVITLNTHPSNQPSAG